MKLSAILGQSLRSIWNNKVRSGLTILGIVIGIAAVIALVGIGKGLQSNVTQRLSGLGTTRITVRSQDPNRPTAQRQGAGGPPGGGAGGGRGGFNFGAATTETLTEADYTAIRNISDIAAASPDSNAQVDVAKTADATTATAYQLYGVDVDFQKIQKLELAQGSFLTATQVNNNEPVAAIGQSAAQEIFGDSNAAVGQKLYIKGQEFNVVGVIKEPTDATPFNNPAQNIYTGYKTWLQVNGKTEFASLVADAKSESAVDNAATAIKQVLMVSHGIADANKLDVGISTSKDLLATASNVATSFTSTLTGIAAISLLVGGIGIMNIMLVTVTERTREIGLRRAVGAKTRHILIQFIIEAVLLTLIGGVLGLLLGVVFGQNIGSLINFGPRQMGGGAGTSVKAVVDVSTVVLAVAISAAIGILFGLFPALKAASLDPVEALRYE